MKIFLYAFLTALPAALPAFADPAAPQDNTKKCAELQAQWNVDSKSHNPLFSQIRAKHERAEIRALKCPPSPKPAPAQSAAPAPPKKP